MTCVPHINRTISGCRGWNHIGLTQEARWHQFCHLSWTATDLVTICYWKWPFIVFIVDFPMKNGHRNSWFPPIGWFPYVGLPGRVCLSTCWIIHYTTVPTKGMWFFIVGKPTITSLWFHRCIACHCFFSHHYNHIADCVLCHSPASFFVASQASCNPDWC